MARTWVVHWTEGRKLEARYSRGHGDVGIVLAHGAGAGQDHPFMRSLATGLAAEGFDTLTFDYPYIAEGRKAPDRPGILLEAHRAVAGRLAERCARVVLAGKSMGGRMSTHLAAGRDPNGDAISRFDAAGVVAYGYPFVPVGKTVPRDTSHLGAVGCPLLFLAGTRDRLGPLHVVQETVAKVPGSTLHVVEGGDHSFRVPKALGRSADEIMAELIAATTDWAGRSLAVTPG